MIRVLKLISVLLAVFSLTTGHRVYAQIEVLDFENNGPEKQSVSNLELTNQIEAEKKVSDPDELIHRGDLIDVDILGSVEYDWRGSITPEGVLSGLGFTEEPVFAACQTERSVAQQIEKEYGRFLKNPKVVVTILDRSKRSLSRLFGAVNQQYRFRIQRMVRLSELIVLAGGITEKASGTIQIIRQFESSCAAKSLEEKSLKSLRGESNSNGKFAKISDREESSLVRIKIEDLLKGKPGANPRIYYGDLITVLEAEPIYVMGAVENPSKLSIRSELTISRAIASSGGLTKGADATDIAIFRRIGNGTEVIKTNLMDIESGALPDLVLEPFDVVDVPGRGRKRSKYPPVIRTSNRPKNGGDLPLRIID